MGTELRFSARAATTICLKPCQSGLYFILFYFNYLKKKPESQADQADNKLFQCLKRTLNLKKKFFLSLRFFFSFYFICLGVLSACGSVQPMCAGWGGQKRVLAVLGLEIQTIVSCDVRAGDFSKRLLSHRPSPDLELLILLLPFSECCDLETPGSCGSGNRTPDFMHARQGLSQLSYIPSPQYMHIEYMCCIEYTTPCSGILV